RDDCVRNPFDTIGGNQARARVVGRRGVEACRELVAALHVVDRAFYRVHLDEPDLAEGRYEARGDELSGRVNLARSGRRRDACADCRDAAIADDDRCVFDLARGSGGVDGRPGYRNGLCGRGAGKKKRAEQQERFCDGEPPVVLRLHFAPPVSAAVPRLKSVTGFISGLPRSKTSAPSMKTRWTFA